MKVLVTGSAGFIGSALCISLLSKKFTVVGIDNHNDYYDPSLKEARLDRHLNHDKYTHYRKDIHDRQFIDKLFEQEKFDFVVNLAAQAGVRYSLENPFAYIDTNLLGFGNILEASRKYKISHLVYASSSSVYGLNTKQPFSTKDSVNHPVSLYASTKKANELMSHSYSHLFDLPTTGLRFFTVYGPYDRPDMALQKFTKSILNNEKIKVFNYGKHRRDFTYIDDIVEGICKVLNKPPEKDSSWNADSPDPSFSSAPYRILNIGNNKPIELLNYIKTLEKNLGMVADIEMLPLQPGDVEDTYADIDDLINNFDYRPKTDLEKGMKEFVSWYRNFYSD